jgi:hypothetical protein
MFRGLQANSGAHEPMHFVRHTSKAVHPYSPAIAVVTAVPAAAPAPVVALAARPVSLPEVAVPAQFYPPAKPVHKHRHKLVAPAAVAQMPAKVKAPLPTARPLPPRVLVPVTTMTAPPPASAQLVPVQTVTAEPPSSTQLVPVQTVTAAPPRT